jgi:hypothetical protein
MQRRTDKGKLLEQVAFENGLCLLITGFGTPRQYFLWDAFRVQRKRRVDAHACIGSGKGWMLNPPQLLAGSDFEEFKRQCVNFQAGFKCIENLPYTKTLLELANTYHRAAIDNATEAFCRELVELEPDDDEANELLKWVRRRLRKRKP